MSVSNPWKSYKAVSLQTAPKGQLVLMLYDGAVKFLEQARLGFSKDDPAEFNQTISNNILRAQDILHELDMSLNMELGGELATILRQLYGYMDRRLLESNLKKEEAGVLEVIQRLTVLRDAWSEMLKNQGGPVPSNQSIGRLQLAVA